MKHIRYSNEFSEYEILAERTRGARRENWLTSSSLLGADVIKVESPSGDPYRSYQGDHYSPHFQAYNRNKRSIALDLKDSRERALFDSLVGEADVFIAVEPFAAFFSLGATPTSSDRPRLAQAYILRTADKRLIAIHR